MIKKIIEYIFGKSEYIDIERQPSYILNKIAKTRDISKDLLLKRYQCIIQWRKLSNYYDLDYTDRELINAYNLAKE